MGLSIFPGIKWSGVMGNYNEENILVRLNQPGSVYQLAIFRILLGLEIVYVSASSIFRYLSLVPDVAYNTNVFPGLINQWVETIAISYLRPITLILAVFLVAGVLTRYILPLLSISFMLLFSFYYSRHNAPHPWLYIWFPLLLLNFTRCSDALSLDKQLGLIKPLSDRSSPVYRWPMEMIASWMVYIYVAAGVSKLMPVYKIWNWMQGGTSQDMMYHRFLHSNYFYLFNRPLFDYSHHAWLFAGLSMVSVGIELFCIMILFTRRYNLVIFCLLMGMHFILYLTGVLGFMQLALVLSISLINPLFIELVFKKRNIKSIPT